MCLGDPTALRLRPAAPKRPATHRPCASLRRYFKDKPHAGAEGSAPILNEEPPPEIIAAAEETAKSYMNKEKAQGSEHMVAARVISEQGSTRNHHPVPPPEWKFHGEPRVMPWHPFHF